MAGDGRERAREALTARLRAEAATLDDIAVAMRWRGAGQRLLRHPREPAYRLAFVFWARELERRRCERV